MGEYAEMMLEGIVCEGCGEFMDGTAPGYPRRCRGCGPDISLERALRVSITPKRRSKPHIRAEIARNIAKIHVCQCGKRFGAAVSLQQHQRDKHPSAVSISSPERDSQ
jgi:hypothetical protein